MFHRHAPAPLLPAQSDLGLGPGKQVSDHPLCRDTLLEQRNGDVDGLPPLTALHRGKVPGKEGLDVHHVVPREAVGAMMPSPETRVPVGGVVG